MSIAQLILEYLKVLLSAPPVAGACALIVVLIFRTKIKDLIDRIGTIKFPGGELTTSQRERNEEVKELPGKPAAPPAPALPPSYTDDRLPNELKNLPPEQAQRLREFAEAEQTRARFWEYRYLDTYLVRNTQEVLDWLAGLGQRTNLQTIDAILSRQFGANERLAIMNALLEHHLIQRSGEQITVTPKGLEYIKYRGPLPPLPPAPTRNALAPPAKRKTLAEIWGETLPSGEKPDDSDAKPKTEDDDDFKMGKV